MSITYIYTSIAIRARGFTMHRSITSITLYAHGKTAVNAIAMRQSFASFATVHISICKCHSALAIFFSVASVTLIASSTRHRVRTISVVKATTSLSSIGVSVLIGVLTKSMWLIMNQIPYVHALRLN